MRSQANAYPHPSTGGTSTLLINALLSAHHHPMRHEHGGFSTLRLEAYSFFGLSGGKGLTQRLGAEQRHTKRLMSVSILSLEPEHRKNRWAPPRHDNLGRSTGFYAMLKRLAFSVVLRGAGTQCACLI
jgi:hypothetical protein